MEYQTSDNTSDKKPILPPFGLRWSLRTMLLCFVIPFVSVLSVLVGITSYLLAERQIVDNASVGIRDTVLQTKNYLDNRIGDIFEQFVSLEESPSFMSIRRDLGASNGQTYNLHDYLSLNHSLDEVFRSYHSIIDSLYVDIGGGKLVAYKTDDVVSHVGYDFSLWYRQYPDGQYHWRGFHSDEIITKLNTDLQVASLFRLTGDASSPIRGMLCFNLRKDFFKTILTTPTVSENGYLMLLTPETASVFKPGLTRFRIPDSELDRLRNQSEESGQMTVQSSYGDKLMVVYDRLRLTHWQIAAVVPEPELLSKAGAIKYLTLALVAAFIVVGIALALLVTRGLTRPVATLAAKINQVYAGNSTTVFNVTGFQEIEFLNNVIADLVSRVDELVTRVRIEQDQKRRAEFAVLQAQINPHFLYNTLYAAGQLCALGESREAAKMINALSTFFRIGLSKGQNVITVAEELDHVRSYLVIQTMKYGDIFSWEIQVDPSLLGFRIVKLSLQPLVENAIYHGVKEKHSFGHIRIYGEREPGVVVLVVCDDGAGIDANALTSLSYALENPEKRETKEAFGLRNVHDRLRLQFGDGFGITVSSVRNEGTVVRVRIPGDNL